MNQPRDCRVVLCKATGVAGCWLVEVEGALDGGPTLAAFQSQVGGAIDSGARWIILDTRRITSFLDQGHGAVVALADQAQKAGGGLILLGLNVRERRIFKMLKIEHYFQFAETIEEALAIAEA